MHPKILEWIGEEKLQKYLPFHLESIGNPHGQSEARNQKHQIQLLQLFDCAVTKCFLTTMCPGQIYQVTQVP